MSDPLKYNLIAVIGPTASGKTAFSANLAQRIGGEIISADSRQVYRQMNLGTGKDYEDYAVQGTIIPAHLIDIADPGYKYSVFEYQRDFFHTFNNILARKRVPVLCGGSGMYIEAVTRQYRLEEVPHNEPLRASLQEKSLDELKELLLTMKSLHNKTDIDTREHALRAIEIEKHYNSHPPQRNVLPDLRTLFLGLKYNRETERERITERLKIRLEMGLVDEVRSLLDAGITPESLAYYGLEYRYITRYLQGELVYQDMVRQLNTAIHQFAKRQRTWFRKMEREGVVIHWIAGEMPLSRKLSFALDLVNA
jgi:tRNA dimethylallyltransferase